MADKPEEKKISSELSSLLNFIPSAYYDLIARVCPGLAFWVALFYQLELIGTPDNPLPSLSGADLFILIVLSYVSGIVLTGFCIAWDWLSIFILAFPPVRKTLNLPGGATFFQRWKLVLFSMDQVSKENDSAGRVLVKAMAEVTLCQNLLTGLIVLAGIGVLSNDEHLYAVGLSYCHYLLIGGSLFLAMVFRQAMFIGRVMGMHAIYCTAAPSPGGVESVTHE